MSMYTRNQKQIDLHFSGGVIMMHIDVRHRVYNTYEYDCPSILDNLHI